MERDFATLYVVELTAAVARGSRKILERYPLRAADSVQLASAFELARELRSKVGFLAFDERLNAAAQEMDLLDPL